MYRFEICANSVASCIAAQEGGADRVELCSGIPEGGTTPSSGMIRKARESISIGLNVIIRPRGGDFLYSPEELEEMTYDIHTAKELGADGLVFGCLTREGHVDKKAMSMLMEAAEGLPVTFHRAFDHAAEVIAETRFVFFVDITHPAAHRSGIEGIQLTGLVPGAFGTDIVKKHAFDQLDFQHRNFDSGTAVVGIYRTGDQFFRSPAAVGKNAAVAHHIARRQLNGAIGFYDIFAAVKAAHPVFGVIPRNDPAGGSAGP